MTPPITPLRGGNGVEPPRQQPKSVEAEQALLGAILVDKSAFTRVVGTVGQEHFALPVHGRIFAAMSDQITNGTAVTPALLRHLFDGDPALQELGGGDYIRDLYDSAVTVSNAPDYARVIADPARRRDIIAACQDTVDAAYQVDFTGSTSADITARLTNRIEELARGGSGRLAGVNPRTLDGLPVPKRRFIVPPWIPMRRATGLYGDGGIGKTTLVQMLCTSAALDPAKFPNANWLELPVLHCRSVLLFCEDDLEEMHARQAEINRAYGCTFDDLGDMLWLPRLGDDSTLMTFENGLGCRTPLFYDQLRLIKAHGAQLVVWDTLSDVFSESEVDRSQARRFVQQGPAYVAREIDGAVICCAHPSLTGLKNGTGSSGSTGWNSAFRSRLYLSSPKEDDNGEPAATDERILTRVKANWAPMGDPIPIRWRDGVFIADRARPAASSARSSAAPQSASSSICSTTRQRKSNPFHRMSAPQPTRQGCSGRDQPPSAMALKARISSKQCDG
jgi:hypothetical protein